MQIKRATGETTGTHTHAHTHISWWFFPGKNKWETSKNQW